MASRTCAYMVSSATSAGEATIIIYFEPGTDPNLAVVNVQNRIAIVKNLLPPLVQREGFIVLQVMPSMLMYVNVFSKDPMWIKILIQFHPGHILQVIRRVRGGAAPPSWEAASIRCVFGSTRSGCAPTISPPTMVMKALSEQSIIGSPGRLGQATGKTRKRSSMC